MENLDKETGLELTIVMPCLNEAETLTSCITKAKSFLSSANVSGEIIVSDNGSTDGSPEIAAKNGARVIHVAERGYGAAIFAGCMQAKGKYIIFGDADDSYDFSDLMPFLKKLREGIEFVNGNRFLGEIKTGAMPWKNRWIGNPLLSGLGKLFFRGTYGDYHCGLRGIRRSTFEALDLRATGMEFASEMVIKAHLKNITTAEVPVVLHKAGRSRASHLKPWRDGWRHLWFMCLSFAKVYLPWAGRRKRNLQLVCGGR